MAGDKDCQTGEPKRQHPYPLFGLKLGGIFLVNKCVLEREIGIVLCENPLHGRQVIRNRIGRIEAHMHDIEPASRAKNHEWIDFLERGIQNEILHYADDKPITTIVLDGLSKWFFKSHDFHGCLIDQHRVRICRMLENIDVPTGDQAQTSRGYQIGVGTEPLNRDSLIGILAFNFPPFNI